MREKRNFFSFLFSFPKISKPLECIFWIFIFLCCSFGVFDQGKACRGNHSSQHHLPKKPITSVLHANLLAEACLQTQHYKKTSFGLDEVPELIQDSTVSKEQLCKKHTEAKPVRLFLHQKTFLPVVLGNIICFSCQFFRFQPKPGILSLQLK